MESIINILFILVLLLYVIKVSLINNKIVIAIYIVLPVVFPYIIYPWLIEQDTQYIKGLLNTPTLMNDFALLIMIEALLVIASIFLLLQQHIGEKMKTRLSWLTYFSPPSLLLALSYFELQVFYKISNYSFSTIAIGYLIFSALLLTILIIGIKWLIKEWEIRLELTFILCLIQILIGIVISSFYNSITTTSILSDDVWKPFLAILIIGLMITGIGFLYTNYKTKKTNN